MKNSSSSTIVLILLLGALLVFLFIFFGQKGKDNFESPIVDGSGRLSYGSKNWIVSFKMPEGWEVGDHYETADAPTSLEITIFDPEYKYSGDPVIDEKATVEISLIKAKAGSQIEKMITATPDIFSIVRNPEYDGITSVLPKYRSEYKSINVAGIRMMRGQTEVHFGPLHMIQDQAIGYAGNNWIEIKAVAEQNHDNAIDSSKKALEEVLTTLTINTIN